MVGYGGNPPGGHTSHDTLEHAQRRVVLGTCWELGMEGHLLLMEGTRAWWKLLGAFHTQIWVLGLQFSVSNITACAQTNVRHAHTLDESITNPPHTRGGRTGPVLQGGALVPVRRVEARFARLGLSDRSTPAQVLPLPAVEAADAQAARGTDPR